MTKNNDNGFVLLSLIYHLVKLLKHCTYIRDANMNTTLRTENIALTWRLYYLRRIFFASFIF